MVHFCVVHFCTYVYNTFGFLTYLHVLHVHFHLLEATITNYSSHSLPVCLAPGSLPFVQLMIGTLCWKTLLMLPQSSSSSSSWIYIGTMHVYTDFNLLISPFLFSVFVLLLLILFIVHLFVYHTVKNDLVNFTGNK